VKSIRFLTVIIQSEPTFVKKICEHVVQSGLVRQRACSFTIPLGLSHRFPFMQGESHHIENVIEGCAHKNLFSRTPVASSRIRSAGYVVRSDYA